MPGQPYRLQDLQTAQQRLAQSGYFESVFVYVDPDSPPQAAPIRVQVREARRGRLLLGVGASTDNGHRLIHGDRIYVHGAIDGGPVTYNPTPGGDQPERIGEQLHQHFPALRMFQVEGDRALVARLYEPP